MPSMVRSHQPPAMTCLPARCYNIRQGMDPAAMDTDNPIDLRAVFEVIDSAEVITFRFVTIPHRLLFDTRHNEMEGPLLALVPRAASLEERVKGIRQMHRRERAEMYNAITGAGYYSLWESGC